MPLLARLRSLVTNLLASRRVEADLDDELRAALDQLTEEKMAAGLNPAAAQREARLELGGVEQVKEEVRAARAGAWIATWGQDVRYGVRALARSPGFAAVVILVLGLGIGANTAIFGLVNSLLYKPLPGVHDPEGLIWLRSSWSYPDFLELRARGEVFSGVAALGGTSRFALGTAGSIELVSGEFVTAGAFAVMGADIALGRGFVPEDDVAAAAPVTVLSDTLWRRRFGADPGVIGRTIRVNGAALRVAGVAARGFLGPEVGLPRELWVPMALHARLAATSDDRPVGDALADRSSIWLNVIARLREGVTLPEAQAATYAIAGQIADAHGDRDRARRLEAATLLPVIGGLDPRDRLEAVWVAAFLMVLVGLVLLVACANVAGLLLARALTRVKEMGIRRALGATRPRLVRQLLTEGLVLALLGGGAGLVLAGWTNELLVALVRRTPIAPPDLGLDRRVLGFTLAVSLLTAVVAGLAPAVQVSRIDPMAALRNQGGLGTRSRLRRALVVTQVGLSLLFLIGAGLFARSLLRVGSVDPGFVVENGLTATIDPGTLRYPLEHGLALERRLLATIEALPGVERASAVRYPPFSFASAQGQVYPGTDLASEDGAVSAGLNLVGPGYFATMGIPVARGRELVAEDDGSAPRVVVVNEALARRLFPGGDAIGRHVRVGRDAPPAAIVGVVAEAASGTAAPPQARAVIDLTHERDRPFVYRPLYQSYQGSLTLVVRARPGARDVAAAVSGAIRAVDPDLGVTEVKTLAEHVDLALLPARLCAALLAGFGLLALGLAAIGLWGLMSASVKRRTHEIGVRVALGATRADVLRLVVGDGVRVVAIGVGLGLGLALLTTRFLAGLLYGVSPVDPTTFVVVSTLFLGVALVATAVPALQATRVDPMVALRAE